MDPWQETLLEAIQQSDADRMRADAEVGEADWSDPKEVEQQVKRLIVDTASSSVLQVPILAAVASTAALLGVIQRDVARIRQCAVALLVVAVLALLIGALR